METYTRTADMVGSAEVPRSLACDTEWIFLRAVYRLAIGITGRAGSGGHAVIDLAE